MGTTGSDLVASIAAIRARHEERKQAGAPPVEPVAEVVEAPVVRDAEPDGEPPESFMAPVHGGPLSTTGATQWCVPPRSVRERGRYR